MVKPECTWTIIIHDTYYIVICLLLFTFANTSYWNRLEIYCRNLAKEYDEVRVISGPLFLPEEKKDGKRYVQYQVINSCVLINNSPATYNVIM